MERPGITGIGEGQNQESIEVRESKLERFEAALDHVAEFPENTVFFYKPQEAAEIYATKSMRTTAKGEEELDIYYLWVKGIEGMGQLAVTTTPEQYVSESEA